MKILVWILSIAIVQSTVFDRTSGTIETIGKFSGNSRIENLIQRLLKKLVNSQAKVSTEYEPKIM